MTEQEQRAAVISEAKTWLRTPFKDCARLKGVGCDCGGILAGVYVNAGIVESLNIPHYSPQFMLHSSEERYIQCIVDHGAHEIEREAVGPGDIVIWKVGNCHSHAAIVIDYPRIIHALKQARGVVWGDIDRDKYLTIRPHKFFSFWGNPAASSTPHPDQTSQEEAPRQPSPA